MRWVGPASIGSFVSALRKRIGRYLTFPVSWVFADDIARGCILAMDRGVSGERYMLDGRPEDVVSTAEACNRICVQADIDHHVEEVAPSDDPELLAVFGPTLMAIALRLRVGPGAATRAGRVQDLQETRIRPHHPRRRPQAHRRVAARDRECERHHSLKIVRFATSGRRVRRQSCLACLAAHRSRR